MSRKLQVPTDPHSEGARLYSRKDVVFNPGLTVLVGCNGSGKSTLMKMAEFSLKSSPGILIMKYDDRFDGGHNLMSKMGFYEDYSGLSSMLCSSEGERIYQGVGRFTAGIHKHIMEKHPKELWILLDAVGSGLSIDKIDEIKELAGIIIEDNPGIDVYFIVSTNEYEFTVGADCIDVTTFKHMSFNDYADYRNYILETAKRKEKRYERINARQTSSR